MSHGELAFIRMGEYIQLVLDAPLAQPSLTRWELYRILAEPVRLRLLALAAEEELAIGELATILGESQPNVSRHLNPLKAAGLVLVRREGTRSMVRLAEAAAADPVVADALTSGRALCDADGSLAKIVELVREREVPSREFFAEAKAVAALEAAPDATSAYVSALARLLPRRALAVDAGTGDGALLDVLAPAFARVVAVDRSEAQLDRARSRIAARGFSNVKLLKAELAGPELREHVGEGADVVFASRLLHHAPRPADLFAQIVRLARPGRASSDGARAEGGAIIILDYARHDDESMRDEADVWLGFEASELRRLAKNEGLDDVVVERLPPAWCGRGKDSHLPWQIMVGRRVD